MIPRRRPICTHRPLVSGREKTPQSRELAPTPRPPEAGTAMLATKPRLGSAPFHLSLGERVGDPRSLRGDPEDVKGFSQKRREAEGSPGLASWGPTHSHGPHRSEAVWSSPHSASSLPSKQDSVVPRLVPGSRQDWGEMEGTTTYRGRRTQVRALPLLAENLDLRGRDKETSKTGGRKLIFIRKQG